MRTSLGGSAVTRSLVEAGFDPRRLDGSFVETARPCAGGHAVLLVQSAWNFLPRREFQAMSGRYPTSMRRRMIVRRAVARYNVRHASHVIALTETMGRMVQPYVNSRVTIMPVTVPMDVVAVGQKSCERRAGTILVPGTVTWFKAPHAALDVAAAMRLEGHSIQQVCFAGSDDGSGSWQHVQNLAASLDIPVVRAVLPRQELIEQMQSAERVVMPSSLESLGFSIGEALWLGAHLIASPIPAHVETAQRAGGTLTWLGDTDESQVGDVRDRGSLVREWVKLGEALGLR